MLVDLHTHTNLSDGTLSPQELIDEVKKYNIGVIAITDHDEIGANIPARMYGKNHGVEVISGVELSIEYELSGKGHLHLLGLFIDPANRELHKALGQLRIARANRARMIIEKLAKLDLPVHYSELEKIIGEGSAGRPHVATLLIKKGIVSSPSEAFKKYIGTNCPAFVPKKKLSIKPAIDLIHQADGLAILAHPYSLGYQTYPETGREILKLRELGLDGIEAYYSSHGHYRTAWLLEFAQKHGLAVSGGSDFHGLTKPDIRPGIGSGDLHIPITIVDELKRYRKKKLRVKQ